jgi:hypothetical protein
MPYDRLDVRINGAVSPLGTGGWVELTDLSVGYYGITKCTLVDNRIKHEATSLAYPNDLIEISRDNFTTILWKGRVSRYTPGGVANEGVTLECSPLEDILKRRTCRWNLNPEMQYNQGLMTDVASPAFNGTVSINHRWTLGEILIDVLEHAYGINTTSRLSSGGGFANMPLFSDIPLHHPDPLTVTNPYASVVTPGPARDYLDQLVWDPAVIKALLDFRVPDIHFRDMDLWSVIEQIVQNAGEHGVFIDPTDLHTPRLVVHQFSNSTLVQVRAGVRGAHVETPSIRLKQDDWVFDDEHVHNLIVIQGTGTKGTTNPTLAASDPLSGKMDKVDAAGKVWRVRNQDVSYFLSGYDAADPRELTNAEKKEPLPQLYVGGVPYTAQVAGWLSPGVCFLKTAISGDVRVKTMYSKTFQVTVGPNAVSNTQYPTAGAFDAYGQFGIVKEMHISEPQFTKERNIEQEFPFVGTLPKTEDLPDGKLVISPVQRRKLDELGYPQLFLSTERDDVTTMRRYAEEYQRRFRDISVKLTMTLDGIKLEDLWRNSGTEVGIRKRVSLIGLEGNRWSDAQLQVTSVRVNVPKNEMIVECSSSVYNVTKLFPAVWKRRHAKRKQEKNEADLHTLLHADQLGDQGDPAPDGEPRKSGIRQLAHESPSPRFVRYPGFREHVVRVTEIPSVALGVYHGTRVDEFYRNDDEWDTEVKFFYLAEATNPPVGPLLVVDDVVTIIPVYRDSLQIFIRDISGSTTLEVEQDESSVCVQGTVADWWYALLTSRCERAYTWIEVGPQSVQWPIPTWSQCSSPGIFGSVVFGRAGALNAFDINGGAHNCQGGVQPKVVRMWQGGMVSAEAIIALGTGACIPAVTIGGNAPKAYPYFLFDLNTTNECDFERFFFQP